jgi:hypothetical protein
MNYLLTKQPSLGDPEALAEGAVLELRPSMQKPYMFMLNNQFREMTFGWQYHLMYLIIIQGCSLKSSARPDESILIHKWV